MVASLDLIIRPDGWEITKELEDIHGISHKQAIRAGVSEQIALNMFLELWGGRMRVAHNRTFDQRIIRIASKRFCDTETVEAWAEKDNHECTMLMAKSDMKVVKYPTLGEAYNHLTGMDHIDAHNAMADATACMKIYWSMLEKRKETHEKER